MITQLYHWMKNIIIFMIFTTVVFNLLGKSSYKKYVGIVTGLILVLLVISPVLKLFGKDTAFDFSLETYQSIAQADDLSNQMFLMEENRNMDVMLEYKEVIAGQVDRLLREKGMCLDSFDANVNQNRESSEFGTVYQMSGTASYLKTEEDLIPDVSPVKINKIKIAGKEENNKNMQQTSLSPMEISIKNMLADFYNINPSNINITIQEDYDGR